MAAHAYGAHGLRQRSDTADFDDVIGAAPIRDVAYGVRPFRVLAVVDGVVRAQRFGPREFFIAAGRDDDLGTAWLYDGNTLWTYDDEVSMGQKTAWAVENGLGGVMIWSIDGDDADGSLITAVDAALP